MLEIFKYLKIIICYSYLTVSYFIVVEWCKANFSRIFPPVQHKDFPPIYAAIIAGYITLLFGFLFILNRDTNTFKLKLKVLLL